MIRKGVRPAGSWRCSFCHGRPYGPHGSAYTTATASICEDCVDKAAAVIAGDTPAPVIAPAALPRGLCSAEQVARRLRLPGVTPDWLHFMGVTGYVPCYKIDDGEPLFVVSEVREHVAQCITSREPTVVPPDLQPLSRWLWQARGWGDGHVVYFLTQHDRVVYIGQARNLWGRIYAHRHDMPKEFGGLFVLSVSKKEVSDVEHAYILALKPPMNIKKNHAWRPSDERVYRKYGRPEYMIERSKKAA